MRLAFGSGPNMPRMEATVVDDAHQERGERAR